MNRSSSAEVEVPDARIGGDEAGRDRLRARGDDRGGEAHDARPLRRLDAHGIGGRELALALDDGHLTLTGEAGEAPRQPLDDPVLPVADGGEIDRGRPETDAMRAHRRRLVYGLGDMQERLRGDAADVEADAAERLALIDKHDLLSKVGGAEGGGVAARPRAEDEDFRLEIRGRGGRRRSGGGSSRSGRRGRGSRWRSGSRRSRGSGRLAGACACIGCEQGPLAHFVADLDMDLADHPVFGRGHVERRLVAFQREDRRFLAYALSRSDEDLDDRHVLEVADVGKPDFLRHDSSLPPSEDDAPHVLDDPGQMAHEARRGGAVDDAVIVGEAEREHQPRLKRGAVPDRRHARADHAEDRHFRRVDDRGEGRAADAAERRNGEGRALHLGRGELARASLFGELAEFAGELDDPLLVDILDDSDHKAVRRIDRDANVPVAPHDQSVASRTQSGVEGREGFQGRNRRAHQERQQRNAVRLRFILLRVLVQRLAEGLEAGDVGFVRVGDVRHVHP